MQEGWTGSVSQVGPVGPTRPVQPLGSGENNGPAPSGHEHDSVEISGGTHAYAKFIVHTDQAQVSVQIIDAMTQKVIREIPREEVQHIADQVKAYMAAKQQHAG